MRWIFENMGLAALIISVVSVICSITSLAMWAFL
jgi:hypothetical protein